MKRFIKEYTVELIAAGVILLGFFLLVEGFPIRDRIVTAFTRAVSGILSGLNKFLTGLTSRVVALTASDALGILLVVLAAGFIVWRIRHRFETGKRWEIDFCPKCSGPVMRIHRTWWDRFLGATFLPEARRYRCMDPKCGWNGLLKRHILHHRRRHERISGPENP